MKNFILLLNFVFLGCNMAIAQEALEVIKDNDLSTIDTKNFKYTEYKYTRNNNYNVSLSLRKVIENDDSKLMIFTITEKSKKVQELLNEDKFLKCSYENTVSETPGVLGETNTDYYFHGLIKNSIKEIVERNTKVFSDTKIYIVILNALSTPDLLIPSLKKTNQEVLSKYKELGVDANKSKFLYCFAFYKNGKLYVDRKDCVNYPH